MKKLLIFIFFTVSLTSVQAQKFAYIDTEYILKNIPEYKEAQKQLDALSKQWQEQIDRKYEDIEKMYQDYEAEEILLTESMKNKRREEILEREEKE